jgi:hypothetical protein
MERGGRILDRSPDHLTPMKPCHYLVLCLALAPRFAIAAAPAFRIEHSVVLTSAGDYHWSQSRPALIPGNPARVIVTTQEIEKLGSHGYRDIYFTETTDGATTWSAPQRIESLRRARGADGVERVFGDLCPQWHAAAGKLLITGKTFGFLANPVETKAKDDRSQERVAYAVYSPAKQQWSGMKIMAMPEKDHEGKPIIEPNAGCNQRWDLPNGDVLLPVRYRKDPKSRVYTTVVTRCSFNGETLTYREHGSEFSITKPRGMYEPSVCGFQGRYFLTMRAEETGYVARGKDGINYEPFVEWKFDDGQPLGSYNTQQHWITHGGGLYLIYTRRGANNDHVMRNRAPIFIARVDPDKLHVLRATEQVLMPETGVDLGGGFAPVDVSPNESWVISSEMAFPPERKNESNRVLLAKIIWSNR